MSNFIWVLMVAGMLLMVATWLHIVISAFHEHLIAGIAVAFMPLMFPLFIIIRWSKVRSPALAFLLGLALFVIAGELAGIKLFDAILHSYASTLRRLIGG